jgi:hypothetical protein
VAADLPCSRQQGGGGRAAGSGWRQRLARAAPC